jgi:hypothetical protein
MNTADQDAALLERYRRLRLAAERVVEEAEAIGTPSRPRCAIAPHHIRRLRRELDGTPRPSSAFYTMSVT